MHNAGARHRLILSRWRQFGYEDGISGRAARHPLREDPAIGTAYHEGYRTGLRERTKRSKND